MNADQLREVRERHEAHQGAIDWAPAGYGQIHKDRALLLAEVDRLKALCGRAADAAAPIAHYAAMREAKPCRGCPA